MSSSSETNLLPPPTELGLPEKFGGWRKGQDQAIVRALDRPERFCAMVMPTGNGKSLAGVALAALHGERALYLTSTKGLQNQVYNDFQSVGMADIRGQNNYECHFDDQDSPQDAPETRFAANMSHFERRNGSKYPSCDEGPCHGGIKCLLLDGGCTYYDAVRGAKNSPMVVTNYSYWMHQLEHGAPDALGQFGLLILDEAHAAPEELSNYLSVFLTPHDLEGTLGEPEFYDWQDMKKWRDAARGWLRRAQTDLAASTLQAKEHKDRSVLAHIRSLKDLIKRLTRLASMQGEWVFDLARRGPMGSVSARFWPVWPAQYAEKHLFGGIGKVLLMSATVRPKTLELLGIKRDFDFAEYPSEFPSANRPVIHVDCVRVDHRMTPEHKNLWVSKIDTIIGQRLDRKGIVHTTSYERAHYLERHSEFAQYMILHDTKTAQATVNRFRQMKPPAILVSPSVTTGYDFPDDCARYQIIAKVPFPDTRDKVLQARCATDPEYAHYVTMQTIVQTVGRAVRSRDDWAENFILDDHWSWFWSRYRKFAPKWFAESVRYSTAIPVPLRPGK